MFFELYKWEQHNPWSDEGSQFLDQRRLAKIQWLQDPHQGNAHNLNNVRCVPTKHFKNKKREYLKAKINELEINSKNKNNRITDFTEGHQPRINTDDWGDLFADTHSILVRWRNHFSLLLNVREVHDVRLTKYIQQTL
jgi:hypothetical protein